MEVVNELQVRGLVVGVFAENCWIIGSPQTHEAICIDPGDEPDEILALAKDMGVTIKLIANSHGHGDHILAVGPVQNATGARFVIHESDLELVHHGWQGMAERSGVKVDFPPPDPSGYVHDGDILEVAGVRLQVLETPGHTQGSVSYYDQGMLFSGDTLFRGSIGRTDMPGGNFEQEMRSIVEKLLPLPDDTIVLPGHMDQSTIGFERQHNPFIIEWLQKTRA
ncbi:MAG: MBL fold metallo-hydrolase [Chloroflexota bacterium]